MPSVPAIGRYTVAPIWARSRPQSVMLSQLLLGEAVEILDRADGMARVCFDRGRQEGFVNEDQLLPVADTVYHKQLHEPAYALDLFGMLMGDSFAMPVTFAARLPAYDGLQLNHDGQRLLYSGQAVLAADLAQDAALMLRFGRKWLYVSELPGGRTPTGVGNVELVQLLLDLLGVNFPRSLASITTEGVNVDFVEQCQTGDVAFFDAGKGAVNHVGLLLPGSEVLHVSGRVRIDAVDHLGIFNREKGRYTHRLRVVKRFLPDAALTQPISLDDRFVEQPENSRQILIF
ncbi:NlpC/P60 family protein [Lewinella sp. IMCC34191]|uniref:NlpC/P60 family protein n=1 Tax=Lewinella sp. IMCC34191 TaxID=2259172 RepID=UPI000E271C20|nr:NlpC/P60 family protein [Lewinella sp. IMCC34191]